MAASDRAKAVVTAVLTVALMALLLLGAEGAVRLRQWVKYGTAEDFESLYPVDDAMGFRIPTAGAKTATIAINSLGFRGPDIPLAKPPQTVRVAFVGASTTFCAEVTSDQMTWPHLVADKLRQTFPSVHWDYINAGVPGYTSGISLKSYRLRVAPLSPDIVVIYHATNDLSHELRKSAAMQKLVDADSTMKQSWLAQYSLLWALVEKNFALRAAQSRAGAQAATFQFDAEDLGLGFHKALVQLVEEAKREGAPLVALATFSIRLRSEQTAEEKQAAAASAQYYMPFMTPDMLITAFARYNEIIRDVAITTGALLIEGEKSIPGDAEHFNDSVHFTDLGSIAQAERVTAALTASSEFKAVVDASR